MATTTVDQRIATLSAGIPDAKRICEALVVFHNNYNPSDNAEARWHFSHGKPLVAGRYAPEYWYSKNEPLGILERDKITGNEILTLCNDVCKGDIRKTYDMLVFRNARGKLDKLVNPISYSFFEAIMRGDPPE